MENTGNFILERDSRGGLILVNRDGVRSESVVPVRPFPISGPPELIILCGADGRELLCLDDFGQLPAKQREMIVAELAHREFMPAVTRIERVYADTDPSEWRIETDHGQTSFLMNDGDTDVRRLGPNRILLVDIHGIRYLIPDVRQLDAASRRILDRYM